MRRLLPVSVPIGSSVLPALTRGEVRLEGEAREWAADGGAVKQY